MLIIVVLVMWHNSYNGEKRKKNWCLNRFLSSLLAGHRKLVEVFIKFSGEVYFSKNYIETHKYNIDL